MGARAIVMALLLAAFAGGPISSLAVAPEGEAVTAAWARTDQPVAEGLVDRTWMWGPEAITAALAEPYAEAPAQLRPVQYFDKARMEITDPAGDEDSPWYVTNGLLVVELVTGRMQVGHDEFEEAQPAEINVAGDPEASTGAPTYRTLAMLLDAPAHEIGSIITATIDRDAVSGDSPDLAHHGVTAGQYVAETGHTVASVFWEFMNSEGVIFENGEYQVGPLFENPFYATGFPITEAYWARVEVGGGVTWVLAQAFERRVLTYTPDNPEGWQVEAGNVGRHYYQWRYESDAPAPPDDPEPEPETLTIQISGIEIAAGNTVGDVTYGARFIGVSEGDLTGSMEVSIDYTPPGPGPNVVNTIVGGSWALTASDGAIEGVIESGSATWDGGVNVAEVAAVFVITSASGELAGIAGSGAFTGTLSHRTFPPRITGTLVFELEGA